MNETKLRNYPNLIQSLGITGIIILGMVLFSPINLLKNIIGKETSMLLYYLLAIGIPFWIIFSISKRMRMGNLFDFNLRNKKIIPLIIIGTIALFFGVLLPIEKFLPMSENFIRMYIDFLNQKGPLTFIMIVILAPILEELIFRGIMLAGLLKQYSPGKSIFISSLLFGLIHLNLYQFTIATILGFFLGWVYCKTGSISISIIIHAVNNFIGYSLRFIIDTKLDMIDEIYGGESNLVISVLVAITIFIVSLYFLRKRFRNENIYF